MLTLAEEAREHVDACEDCRTRWERGERAVDVQRTCRALPPGPPSQCRIVFVAGERARVPGAKTFIAREATYDSAEAKAREWNAPPADLSYGVFAVEMEP